MSNLVKYEGDSDLLPYRIPINPIRISPEHPLSSLAPHAPNSTAELMRKYLRNVELSGRLEALKSVSRDQKDETVAWLCNRNPGEKNLLLELERDAIVSSRGWFASGEQVYSKTRVKIW